MYIGYTIYIIPLYTNIYILCKILYNYSFEHVRNCSNDRYINSVSIIGYLSYKLLYIYKSLYMINHYYNYDNSK